MNIEFMNIELGEAGTFNNLLPDLSYCDDEIMSNTNPYKLLVNKIKQDMIF